MFRNYRKLSDENGFWCPKIPEFPESLPRIPEFWKSRPMFQNGLASGPQHHQGSRSRFRSRVRPLKSGADKFRRFYRASPGRGRGFPEIPESWGRFWEFRNSGKWRFFENGWLIHNWPETFSRYFCMLRVQYQSRPVCNGAR